MPATSKRRRRMAGSLLGPGTLSQPASNNVVGPARSSVEFATSLARKRSHNNMSAGGQSASAPGSRMSAPGSTMSVPPSTGTPNLVMYPGWFYDNVASSLSSQSCVGQASVCIITLKFAVC